MAETYLTVTQLASRFGVHRATIWRWTKTDPGFPGPVKLSAQCTRWKNSEIERWEKERGSAG